MKTIEMLIECPSCKGTGLYSGMGEKKNVAIICHNCEGSGKHLYKYSYNEFTARKKKEGVKRVYLSGYGYCIADGILNFTGIGEIDMDKEGVSYDEFAGGKMPTHIKQLACPMLADQGGCHDINGFTDRCNDLGRGWGSDITKCKNRDNKKECWELFENK